MVKGRRPRVVYWNNSPTPYMVQRFNAIQARGCFDFEAWFSHHGSSEHAWVVDEEDWAFPHRYVAGGKIAGKSLHIFSGLRAPSIDLLISLYAEPAFLMGWALAQARRIKTAFWAEVTFDSWVQRRWWKEMAKRAIFPRADGIMTAGTDGRRFVQKYGVQSERIHVVRHGIDVKGFSEGAKRSKAAARKYRLETGIAGICFLYVGRLWWGKGLDYLLDAFADVRRETLSSLLIVGSGPEESRLRRRVLEEDIPNVVFVSFTQQHDLPLLYSAADVFIFPTLGDPYGLVVDEAMACSLPIVSTTAAGEIADRVHEGLNGFLVPPMDSTLLGGRMRLLAKDSSLRKRMGSASGKAVASHTAERWADDFETAVDRVLSAPRRRGNHKGWMTWS